MSTRTHPNPAGGRWAWREYLPTSIDEWLELRNHALEVRPAGIDLVAFTDWVLAETRGEAPRVSAAAGAKYRRVLFELAQSAPPPKKRTRRRDAGATTGKSAALMAVGAAAGLAVAHLTGNPALALLAPVIPR